MKKKIKFPVIKQGQSSYPNCKNYSGIKCPVCKKSMIKNGCVEQIVLNFGALRKDKNTKDSWSMGHDLGGFMSVGTHIHSDKSKWNSSSVEVVDLSENGQADMYFCSPKCLRKFFSSIVDQLEKGMFKKGK